MGEHTGAAERGVNIGDVRRRVTAAMARPACARAAASLTADGATSALCGRTTPTPTESPHPPTLAAQGDYSHQHEICSLSTRHPQRSDHYGVIDWLLRVSERTNM